MCLRPRHCPCCCLQVRSVGQLEISVGVVGVGIIHDAPFRVSVSPGPLAPNRCVVAGGAALIECAAGTPTSVTIRACDRLGHTRTGGELDQFEVAILPATKNATPAATPRASTPTPPGGGRGGANGGASTPPSRLKDASPRNGSSPPLRPDRSPRGSKTSARGSNSPRVLDKCRSAQTPPSLSTRVLEKSASRSAQLSANRPPGFESLAAEVSATEERGVYSALFELLEPGSYELHVRCVGARADGCAQPVRGSPFALRCVAGALEPSCCTFAETSSSAGKESARDSARVAAEGAVRRISSSAGGSFAVVARDNLANRRYVPCPQQLRFILRAEETNDGREGLDSDGVSDAAGAGSTAGEAPPAVQAAPGEAPEAPESPARGAIRCKYRERGDGFLEVRYPPVAPGRYSIWMSVIDGPPKPSPSETSERAEGSRGSGVSRSSGGGLELSKGWAAGTIAREGVSLESLELEAVSLEESSIEWARLGLLQMETALSITSSMRADGRSVRMIVKQALPVQLSVHLSALFSALLAPSRRSFPCPAAAIDRSPSNVAG